MATDNIDETKYRVTLESVGFSGHRLETKEMTEAELKEWMTLIHEEDAFDEIVAPDGKMKQFALPVGVSSVIRIGVGG